MPRSDPAVRWLLESDEPAVRYRTPVELLDRPDTGTDTDVAQARHAIPGGRLVRGLLSSAVTDYPYRKWAGCHWRLVSLADLRYPSCDEALRPLVDAELDWASAATPASTSRSTGPRRCSCVRSCPAPSVAASRSGHTSVGCATRRTGITTSCSACACSPTVDGAWWRVVGGTRSVEAVDWGRSGTEVPAAEMVTLHALRVLREAGRT